MIIETSGYADALQSALRGLAYGGTISYVAFAKPLLKVLTSDAKRISITPKLFSPARAANRTRIIRAGAVSVLKKPAGNC
ncbi:zinc-type alcohol dehydrogenase-like protein YcjQ [Escherichia coli]|uniref:Zinc-type alcohol dehydrogenase-like protein YcjQ n=1 Tax=Escherichia coli TaxID=562 RepID=A0A376RJF8_ECOLX|nr:zinc-type alcohol dehydrogenase-like protein YcjQ [Escherichia coli]